MLKGTKAGFEIWDNGGETFDRYLVNYSDGASYRVSEGGELFEYEGQKIPPGKSYKLVSNVLPETLSKIREMLV